mmetsp:Transcript_4818/g.6819  ORF Transcript_4818/g.6819 Transcript_4818/m.6819 type:complete len:97 (+) Transcript_4818:36-326(+)
MVEEGHAVKVGGFGEEREVNQEVLDVVTNVKAEIEKVIGESFISFEPKTYKSQVVAGTNYLVKVHVGKEKMLLVKVHKPLPHKIEPPKVMEAYYDE